MVPSKFSNQNSKCSCQRKYSLFSERLKAIHIASSLGAKLFPVDSWLADKNLATIAFKILNFAIAGQISSNYIATLNEVTALLLLYQLLFAFLILKRLFFKVLMFGSHTFS